MKLTSNKVSKKIFNKDIMPLFDFEKENICFAYLMLHDWIKCKMFTV